MCLTNYNNKNEKYKHLTYTERTMMERWYNKEKKKIIEISKLLNKSERTIRREIKRGMVKVLNTHLIERYEYSADKAQAEYDYNIKAKGPELKIFNDYKLVRYIEKEMNENKKSPEAIVEEMKSTKRTFQTEITAKTIRNNIKLGIVFNLVKEGYIYKKRKVGSKNKKKISNKIPPEKSIEYRPKEADERSEYGHWEGDCVVGRRKGKGAVLFTLTERMTREEIIVKMERKTKECVVKALNKIERQYGKRFYNKFKTITFDNGSEFNGYNEMEASCLRKSKRTSVYYAHPYNSGERGSNENNNRLIRRWIPKGTNIGELTKEFIQKVQNWINNYPRKIFGYQTTNMILLNI